ncbi:MAG: hypothetical protein ACRD3D_08140 [Terriglobia bacterium]
MSKERTLKFFPLTGDLVPACNNFNERLRAAGFDGQFSSSPNAGRDGDIPCPMQVERYVGIDEEGDVRGAYLLRWQFLWLRGETFLGAAYGYPISEGVVNKKYAMVGVSVLRDATKRCEHLYVLGGSGREGNVFRIARHAGWELQDVPFLFRVIRGGPFLRKLPQMRSQKGRILVAKIGSSTGLSGIAVKILHGGSALYHGGRSSLRQPSDVTVEEVNTFSGIGDELWLRVRSQYGFCVVRDGSHLEPMFPPSRSDLHRLIVRRQGTVIGWTVVMTQSLSRLQSYLGDVAPGLIVDAFGDVNEASHIVRAATAYLADKAVDAVLTNASHGRWIAAYKHAGFLSRPSQFPLIVSRSLARRIGNLSLMMAETHMSRGDGDGVHYLR